MFGYYLDDGLRFYHVMNYLLPFIVLNVIRQWFSQWTVLCDNSWDRTLNQSVPLPPAVSVISSFLRYPNKIRSFSKAKIFQISSWWSLVSVPADVSLCLGPKILLVSFCWVSTPAAVLCFENTTVLPVDFQWLFQITDAVVQCPLTKILHKSGRWALIPVFVPRIEKSKMLPVEFWRTCQTRLAAVTCTRHLDVSLGQATTAT